MTNNFHSPAPTSFQFSYKARIAEFWQPLANQHKREIMALDGEFSDRRDCGLCHVWLLEGGGATSRQSMPATRTVSRRFLPVRDVPSAVSLERTIWGRPANLGWPLSFP